MHFFMCWVGLFNSLFLVASCTMKSHCRQYDSSREESVQSSPSKQNTPRGTTGIHPHPGTNCSLWASHQVWIRAHKTSAGTTRCTDHNQVQPVMTYQSEDPSVPATSRTSYPSSSWKSMKTKAIVSPGSARIVHVQSALLPYSKGKWGLEIIPLWPRKVPPQASSAANRASHQILPERTTHQKPNKPKFKAKL